MKYLIKQLILNKDLLYALQSLVYNNCPGYSQIFLSRKARINVLATIISWLSKNTGSCIFDSYKKKNSTRSKTFYFFMLKFMSILKLEPSWSYRSWIYNYLCNQCLSPLTLWVWILLRQGVLDTILCDKVCYWLATGWWFSPCTPVSSTNKADATI